MPKRSGQLLKANGVLRMSISVPVAIRRRMEPLMDKINWSGVASKAFLAMLTEIDRGNFPVTSTVIDTGPFMMRS